MVIKQINSMTDVQALCWNKLVQEKDPFLRHEFLAALEKSGAVCPATGWQPQHLLVFDQQELIAAMPLYLKNNSSGEYVFDQQWAEAYYQSGIEYYPKWVNSVPFTPCQGQRILIKTYVDQEAVIHLCLETLIQRAGQYSISSLHCLFPLLKQTQMLRKKMLVRVGVQFQWFNKGYENFDDYLQSFSSRHRKNIKKERRKIIEQGITFQRFTGQEITEHQWEVFFDFYEMTYLKRGQTPYLTVDFFKQLAVSMAEQILLVFAIKDQSYVGAALSFIGEKTLYGRYWGCYEEYNNLHFETCYYQGLEYCLEHQLQRFDSGAQGEHKISRGFEPVTTYSTHWILNPHFEKLITQFLEREEKFIQKYKKDCLQQLPFKK